MESCGDLRAVVSTGLSVVVTETNSLVILSLWSSEPCEVYYVAFPSICSYC